MNAYYQNNRRTFIASNTRPCPGTAVGDKLISFICAIVAIFTSAIAVKIEKALLCTGGFVCAFGIIGSMEAGSINMLLGLFVCACISLIELAVFKSMFKK